MEEGEIIMKHRDEYPLGDTWNSEVHKHDAIFSDSNLDNVDEAKQEPLNISKSATHKCAITAPYLASHLWKVHAFRNK